MVFVPTEERIAICTLGFTPSQRLLHSNTPTMLSLNAKGPPQASGLQSTSSHGEVVWGAIADTPNYNLIAYHDSRAHSSKGYHAIVCCYIQMTEQLRLLYQLQGNCSHSAETGTLKSSIIATERGLKTLPAFFFCQ